MAAGAMDYICTTFVLTAQAIFLLRHEHTDRHTKSDTTDNQLTPALAAAGMGDNF